jgi:hypothetical protein
MFTSLAEADEYIYFGGPDYYWKISKDQSDSKRLYRRNVKTDKLECIYETDKDFLKEIRISPSDNSIALVVKEKGESEQVEGGWYELSVLPRNSMVIIDTGGNEIDVLEEDVRELSWSPDGEKIAYITGTYREGGVGFKTTGVWIYDLKHKTRTRIRKDFPHRQIEGIEGGGIEIAWAGHDNNIYIRDFDYLDGIYRYNTESGKSEKSDCKGIDFSPDGKYYIGEGKMYLTATNEDITDRLKTRFGPEWSQFFMKWVFDRGHYLHFFRQKPIQQKDARWTYVPVYNVIYDIEEDKVIKDVTLPVSRWKGSRGQMVFDKNGQVIIETFESVVRD